MADPSQEWTSADVPSLTGAVAVVTGASSGIGAEIARALARHRAKVMLACRDPRRGAQVASSIRDDLPGADVEVATVDLASLADVERFAGDLALTLERLDLLVNNAGVSWTPRRLSLDGHELQFATNHLGHFALTGHLLPLLLATRESRVVATTSQVHRRARLDLTDIEMARSYGRQAAYSRSKLANLLFVHGLQRRLSAAGSTTTAVSANPGSARTNIDRNCPLPLRAVIALTAPFATHAVSAAAAVTVRAATDRTLSGGEYVAPGRRWELVGPPVLATPSRLSRDEALQDRLWTMSENLTGVTYDFKST